MLQTRLDDHRQARLAYWGAGDEIPCRVWAAPKKRTIRMKIIINGAGGRMGKEVAKLAQSGFRGAELMAGVDAVAQNADFPCYTNWDDVKENADCIVDFSFHGAIGEVLCYAKETNTAVVVATTGHTEEEMQMIKDASEVIPIFWSANMSLGVALLAELAAVAARSMPDADIEIIEKHHNRKLDAPSGTALMLANAIKKVRESAEFVFGRHGQAKRTQNEIGIHAIRMGNIVGEHEILIGTDNETITLKHEAHNRALFAEGALAAASFMAGKPKGFYSMKDIIGK